MHSAVLGLSHLCKSRLFSLRPMWLLLCATALLTLSGLSSARHWLYGWHREDPRRQLEAALQHGGLTLLLCLYGLSFGVQGLPLNLSVISLFSLMLGVLVIKRAPPRELSRHHLRTSTILER